MTDPEAVVRRMMILYPQLKKCTAEEILDLACSLDLGVWSEVKRGYRNAPFHWK